MEPGVRVKCGPRPHIPSDMGTGGGENITRDMGPWGPKNSGDMGIRGDLGTQGFCSIHNLRRHVRTNCMCKSKNMFMQWYTQVREEQQYY